MTTVAEAREAVRESFTKSTTDAIELLVRAILRESESRTPEPVAEEPAADDASDEDLSKISSRVYAAGGLETENRRALYNAGKAAGEREERERAHRERLSRETEGERLTRQSWEHALSGERAVRESLDAVAELTGARIVGAPLSESAGAKCGKESKDA